MPKPTFGIITEVYGGEGAVSLVEADLDPPPPLAA